MWEVFPEHLLLCYIQLSVQNMLLDIPCAQDSSEYNFPPSRNTSRFCSSDRHWDSRGQPFLCLGLCFYFWEKTTARLSFTLVQAQSFLSTSLPLFLSHGRVWYTNWNSLSELELFIVSSKKLWHHFLYIHNKYLYIKITFGQKEGSSWSLHIICVPHLT